MAAPNLTQLLASAQNAMARGQPSVARQNWQQALALAPDHPAALNGLGMLAMTADRTAEAADAFLRAATSDPNSITLWLNHAKAARVCGDDAAERSSLLKAIALDPLSLVANVRLAENAERLNDLKEAGIRYRAVTELSRSLPEIPPDARAAVEHARRFVDAETAALQVRIEKALVGRRVGFTHGEGRRVDAAIDHMFGRRPIYTNQCSGLHIPFLPADEFFDPASFDWLPRLEEATETIRSELLQVLDEQKSLFEPYVALPSGVPQNIWTPLDKSQDWSSLHLWRHGLREDAACDLFPKTAAILDGLPLPRLPKRMPTVFFSVLAAKTHIPPHTGVTNARAIIHLPLIVPDGCRFRVGGETREWVAGTAMAFDDTIEHEAWNDSAEPRAILILDTWNPHLTLDERAMVVDFYGAEESADSSPEL